MLSLAKLSALLIKEPLSHDVELFAVLFGTPLFEQPHSIKANNTANIRLNEDLINSPLLSLKKIIIHF